VLQCLQKHTGQHVVVLAQVLQCLSCFKHIHRTCRKAQVKCKKDTVSTAT
jgi:hypothetical protein